MVQASMRLWRKETHVAAVRAAARLHNWASGGQKACRTQQPLPEDRGPPAGGRMCTGPARGPGPGGPSRARVADAVDGEDAAADGAVP